LLFSSSEKCSTDRDIFYKAPISVFTRTVRYLADVESPLTEMVKADEKCIAEKDKIEKKRLET